MMEYRVEQYGAAVDASPQHNRQAFQATLDACVAAGGGDMRIGDGTWNLWRAGAGQYDRFSCLSTFGRNVRIIGSGKNRTTLRVAGDAGASTLNVIGVNPGAQDVEIADLTIDTLGLYNMDAGEQTHAIAIGSGVYTSQNGTDRMPVRNVTVRDVRFRHRGAPRADGTRERWGDAVRVAGNTPATSAINVRLLDLDFESVGRSAIAMQRNVIDLAIRGCYFNSDEIGGTCIDGEATGGGWDTGLVVEGNRAVRTLPGGDNFFVSLTSQTHFVVRGNVLRGRGISLVRCSDGVIDGNVIDVNIGNDYGCLELANKCERVNFVNNTVRRTGSHGACVRVLPHAGQCATGLVFTANQIDNDTNGACMLLDSIGEAVLAGNKLRGNGSPVSMGIYLETGTRSVRDVSIEGGLYLGLAHSGVRLHASSSDRTFERVQLMIPSTVARRIENGAFIATNAIASGL